MNTSQGGGTNSPRLQSRLIPIGTTIVAPTTTPFIARDRFVVNTKKSAPVKISYVSGDFKNWFLVKKEQPFGGSIIKYSKLSRLSDDDSIIAELGGEEKTETMLTEVFTLMQAQKNCESGPLLTNGRPNIFYVKDVSGVFCAVHVSWRDGWDVCAYSVRRPFRWLIGSRVFSRDSR